MGWLLSNMHVDDIQNVECYNEWLKYNEDEEMKSNGIGRVM